MIKKFIIMMIAVAAITGATFAADPQAPTMPFYWVNGKINNWTATDTRKLIVFNNDYGSTVNNLQVTVNSDGTFKFNIYELKYFHQKENWLEVDGKPVFIMAIVRHWGSSTPPLNMGTAEIASVNWDKGYIDVDLSLVTGGGPNDFSGGMIAGYVSSEATKQMIAGAGMSELPDGAATTTGANGVYLFSQTFNTGNDHGVTAVASSYDPATKSTAVSPTKVSWVNFALKGGGIVDTGLYIERDGDGLNASTTISWAPLMINNPAIWMLTGSGVGVYTDAPTNWVKVYENGAIESAYTGEFTLAANGITHQGQVGAGYAEVYYKAVAQGGVFATAPAVGKVNVVVAGGKKWTLFNSPFLALPGDPNLILGKQGAYTPGSEPATSVRIFSFENSGWNRVSYYDGNSWVAVPGANAAISDPQQGLYLLTKSTDADKVFSIVGNVKPLNTVSAYTITQNWNVVGIPYPRQMDLNLIKLDVGTKNDNWEQADRVYGRLNNGFNTCSFLKADGTWAPQPGVTGVDVINATPLYYRSRTVNPINWNLTPSIQGYQ
ncbi:hypothetical protein A3K32_04785 [candidate division WOR-1 bacterium RIFOXYB2_FULL_45_9]|nr:MAG: hypothetical protein A3K32_04785 [candidate division WOR-1 bacterium RIFOXYB2_FULL_45_9]OGC31261.1 MAG: hypothetical protein A2346_07830 [candidate division WOR-1 bacterium RIFOXYB12_FULL_52_16]